MGRVAGYFRLAILNVRKGRGEKKRMERSLTIHHYAEERAWKAFLHNMEWSSADRDSSHNT